MIFHRPSHEEAKRQKGERKLGMMAFYAIRKTYMTLLETLIAVSILSLLLVFVFGFFRELSELTRLTDKAQKESFQMRYLESRLNYIFERVVNEKESARDFFFYTQPIQPQVTQATSLILTFDNDVRLNPTFSQDILGRLYVDKKFTFCLATWPLHVPDPHEYMQEEVLFENVANVKYFFYAAPEKIQSQEDLQTGAFIDTEKKYPEKDKWHENEWAITYNQMPSIIKLIVEVANKPDDLIFYHHGMPIDTTALTFYFVLPSSKNPIHYPPQSD